MSSSSGESKAEETTTTTDDGGTTSGDSGPTSPTTTSTTTRRDPTTSDPPSTTTTSTSDPPEITTTSSASPTTSTTPEAPPPVTTPSKTSAAVVKTTYVVTSGGQSSIVVVETTLPINAAPSESSSSNLLATGSHSKVGAIVGGTIGGIAGLIALLVLGYWCWRRRRRNYDKDFDGNFDPVSTNRLSGIATHSTGGTLPNIPLEDEEEGIRGRTELGGGVVTPFTGWSAPNSPQMSQTNGLPSGALVMSNRAPGSPHRSQFSVSSQYPPSAYADPFGRPSSPPQRSTSPTNTAASYASYAYPMAVPDRTGSASPPHSAHSIATSSIGSRPSSKEHEAFRVVNPDQPGDRPRQISGAYSAEAHQAYLAYGPSSPNNRGSGSWTQYDASYSNGTPSSGDSEIPPIYDSIPGNNNRSAVPEKGAS